MKSATTETRVKSLFWHWQLKALAQKKGIYIRHALLTQATIGAIQTYIEYVIGDI